MAGSLQTAPDAARQLLDVARQMLRYSLEETKRSVMDLRSQALESRDLQGALTNLARQMTLGTRVQAEVRVTGQPQRLDAAQEHHLLRIGLEALTNALKHGDATRIDIELRFGPDGDQPDRERRRPGPGTRRAGGAGRAFRSPGRARTGRQTRGAAGDRQPAGRRHAPRGDGAGSSQAFPPARAEYGESMADKLRIMLVDDHYLVRMGLASIIALEPDMTVCARGGDRRAGAGALPHAQPRTSR